MCVCWIFLFLKTIYLRPWWYPRKCFSRFGDYLARSLGGVVPESQHPIQTPMPFEVLTSFDIKRGSPPSTIIPSWWVVRRASAKCERFRDPWPWGGAAFGVALTSSIEKQRSWARILCRKMLGGLVEELSARMRDSLFFWYQPATGWEG